ncbi:hypothetical protein [Neisseria wadsworthii]|uniref:Uncharacterized protein n=1 Tax=Neisseria wadsworthii 9715 TaxID=1030841 RepID=G4CMH4_9NEIS|nr:hypothetical protein [Neisseria wadsworthii]EGZ51083.1 hypothetical protein HMPREF9370_0283 [Neisseria wadsworthii 9715]
MLALAVLFGLLVWLGLTVLAAYLCGKLTSKLGLGRWIGRFVGFMLLMGSVFVYWTWEFMAVKNYIEKKCHDEAGVKIYVDSKEWRRLSNSNMENSAIFDHHIKLNSKKYYIDRKELFSIGKITDRLILFYVPSNGEDMMYTKKNKQIIIDINTDKKNNRNNIFYSWCRTRIR